MERKTKQTVYWKQVLITICTVYPLIIIVDFVLKNLLSLQFLNPYLSIFFTVIIVAALMVYPVIPLVNRLLGTWVTKK